MVGAGTAGCLVAARLGAAGHHVLLVEGGPDFRKHELRLRDGWGFSRENAWGYTSEPDAAGATTEVLRTKLERPVISPLTKGIR